MMEWEDPPQLQVRLLVSIGIFLWGFFWFHKVLTFIIMQNASYQASVVAATLSKQDNQLELEEESTTTNGDYVQADRDDEDTVAHNNKNNNNNQSNTNKQPSLNYQQKLLVTSRLWVLMFLNYLLLVYLPGGTLSSLLALLSIFALTLHSYLWEEVSRRQRYDRIVCLLSLLFGMAAALTMVTYCSKTLAQGTVYRGPARIVGMDDQQYDNGAKEVLRADLRVAWGSDWACDNPLRDCVADVQGALCSTTTNNNDRTLLTEQEYEEDMDELSAEYGQDEEEYEEMNEEAEENLDDPQTEELGEYEEEVSEIATEEVEIYDEALDEAYEEYYDEEQSPQATNSTNDEEALEEEVQELEQENEQLKEQNQELQDAVDEEEEEEEEIEDEVYEEEEEFEDEVYEEEEEEIEEVEDEVYGEGYYNEDDAYVYYFDDDLYEDSYWDGYDWDSVWGEYACEDLFDSDLEGQTYDPNVPAGQDEWPTITIYGSCRSCQAFLDDYYSTEYFQSIKAFEHQAWSHLTLAGALAILAVIFHAREKMRPEHEKAVVLLTNEGGVAA